MRESSSSKQLQDMEAILETSKAMMVERDPDRLLNLIVRKATEVLEAERGSIFLADYDTQELWSRVAQAVEIAEIRFHWDKGIAGNVFQKREIINIKDAYQDNRFNPEIDKKTGYHTRTILCGPLINHKNEVIGALQVLNKKDGVFNDYDESLLTAFSAQAAIAIENAQLYQELELTFKSFLKTMASAIDARDPTTAGHSERVARYSLSIAKAMGFNETEQKVIDYAALLHDIGKIGVRDNVLLKPGRLTPEEYAQMKNHVVKTKEILDNMFFARELREIPHIASSHHEKIDGSGYPSGLKGNNLSRAAKIMAIADVYDALVATDRPYKKAMTPEEALAILEQGKGTQFDPEIVDIFRNKKLYEIERRSSDRQPANILMDYFVTIDKKQLSESVMVQTTTVNISNSGLVFSSKRPLAIGAVLNTILHISGRDLKVQGKIVRSERLLAQNVYNNAMEFIGLTPEQETILVGLPAAK